MSEMELEMQKARFPATTRYANYKTESPEDGMQHFDKYCCFAGIREGDGEIGKQTSRKCEDQNRVGWYAGRGDEGTTDLLKLKEIERVVEGAVL